MRIMSPGFNLMLSLFWHNPDICLLWDHSKIRVIFPW
jgi:hypothetical protein